MSTAKVEPLDVDGDVSVKHQTLGWTQRYRFDQTVKAYSIKA